MKAIIFHEERFPDYELIYQGMDGDDGGFDESFDAELKGEASKWKITNIPDSLFERWKAARKEYDDVQDLLEELEEDNIVTEK